MYGKLLWQGDTVHLMRTIGSPSPETINNASSWQFYTGGNGADATWSAPGDVSAAQPLFTWLNRTGVVTATVSMQLEDAHVQIAPLDALVQFHPALSKYIVVVGCPTVSPLTVAHFDIYLLEVRYEYYVSPSGRLSHLACFVQADSLTGPFFLISYLPSFGPQVSLTLCRFRLAILVLRVTNDWVTRRLTLPTSPAIGSET